MSSAALSDDGAKIVYTRGRETLANVWRIPLLRDRPATWADAEQLTSDEAFIEFIDVTPNGLELVNGSDRRGNQDIWRMPSAGGDMQPVTSDPTPDWRPSVSADGKQIMFYAYRSGNRELWTMPLAGGPARQVTFHEAGDYHPVWSPDGSHIAFASLALGTSTCGSSRQLAASPAPWPVILVTTCRPGLRTAGGLRSGASCQTAVGSFECQVPAGSPSKSRVRSFKAFRVGLAMERRSTTPDKERSSGK